MNCLDCTINERTPSRAVGICINCGAAVCARCARLEHHPVPQPSTVGNPLRGRARAVSCVPCDWALDHHRGTAVAAATP